MHYSKRMECSTGLDWVQLYKVNDTIEQVGIRQQSPTWQTSHTIVIASCTRLQSKPTWYDEKEHNGHGCDHVLGNWTLHSIQNCFHPASNQQQNVATKLDLVDSLSACYPRPVHCDWTSSKYCTYLVQTYHLTTSLPSSLNTDVQCDAVQYQSSCSHLPPLLKLDEKNTERNRFSGFSRFVVTSSCFVSRYRK